MSRARVKLDAGAFPPRRGGAIREADRRGVGRGSARHRLCVSRFIGTPPARISAPLQLLATLPSRGREIRALHHRHAPFPVWPFAGKGPGSGALGRASGLNYMARRPRPAGDFCLPSVPLRPGGAFSHPHHLAHRPAHRGRSAPGGTLGRNLPGRVTSSVTRRRRRSSPAFERLRSVPGRKDVGIMREVLRV